MKSSAIAHANIALVKYWGRSDSRLNIPLNDSVSMTKCGTDGVKLQSHTTIEFSEKYTDDTAFLDGNPVSGVGCQVSGNKCQLSGRSFERVLAVVNPLRKKANCNLHFKMASKNDFPTQSGLASSAAGFAALAAATADALKLKLTKEELSTYARLGSGSACRSIHGGFVQWHKGTSHETSFAEQICKPNDFQMNAVIAIVSEEKKEVTSDAGHESSPTSPLNEMRVQKSQEHAVQVKKAILDNDFSTAGKIAEQSCMMMHSVMLTSKPPLLYWTADTGKIIKKVHQARENGLECYFTIDAGPNVHVLCRPEKVDEIQKMLVGYKTIVAGQGEGAKIADQHLF